MKTKIIIAITATTIFLGGAVVGYAAAQTYKFKCGKCGLILEFSDNSILHKCPSDGTYMSRL